MGLEQTAPQPPSPVDEGLVDALVTTSFVTMAVISRVGAAHELSLSMVRMLGILWDRRPRMTELATHLGLEKQTLSGLVARAEKRGLVARVANEDDARATDVVLTPQGRHLMRRLRGEASRAIMPLLHALDPADRNALQALLRQLIQRGPA